MKKVLSFVLVLSMILGSFGMAFAGSAQDDALTVLSGLGVFAGYTDGSLGGDKVVTRAEAATLIIKAMDLQDYAVGKTTFTDMDEAKWAEPFVAYAVSLGFVKGNTDGTFAPNDTVTSDQMITMLVQAIGYKAEYLTGGYPGAFVNTAKALGILEGVKSGAAGCTRGDVAQMIYNALDVPFVSYDSEGGLQYTVLTGDVYDCFMERLIDVKTTVTGVVKGNEDSKINLKPYQGAYATLIKDNGDVVAVDDIKSVFVTGDIADGVLTLADDTEYKLERVEGDVVAEFVNGEYTTDVELTTSAIDVTLAVKTSGKFVTEVYSIAYWTPAATVLWDEDYAKDLEENFVIDEATFVENDDEEIDTDEFVLEGVASLDKIAENDVVTYYVNADDEIVKVEVGTESVEGTVSKVTKDDKYVINGKKYEAVTAIELGNKGEFFLNFAGEIAFFEEADDSVAAEDYAVVTFELGVDTISAKEYGDADEEIVKIKMMTADGKEAVYVVADDAEITSEAGITADDIIAYHLNKDGEIDKIEEQTAVPAGEDEVNAKKFIAGKKINSAVVVFEKTVDEDGEVEYAVLTLADVPVAENLAETTYVLDDEEVEADKEVVVIFLQGEYGEETTKDEVYGVLVGWEQEYDAEEEDTFYNLSIMVDGNEAKEYVSNFDFTLPEEAQLYELKFVDGEIDELEAIDEPEAAIVAGIKDGWIAVEGADGYTEVAEDVVVYLINEDGDFVASAFSKIAKEDSVWMYELDDTEDEIDGYDIIVFEKAE